MNWSQIVMDLEVSGMTQVEIARAVGCSQTHISDLKRGKRGTRIDFALGGALVALHRQRASCLDGDRRVGDRRRSARRTTDAPPPSAGTQTP